MKVLKQWRKDGSDNALLLAADLKKYFCETMMSYKEWIKGLLGLTVGFIIYALATSLVVLIVILINWWLF
jgi:hypothetical protein